MKDKYYRLLASTKKDGINDLINHMILTKFDEAPCSTKHHLSKKGGLLEHSLNVYEHMTALAKAFNYKVPESSIILCALLHDLGKAGDYGKPNYVENVLKSGRLSEAEPYKINKDLHYIPHEIRSLAIAERYIRLSEDEAFAILYHNGMYSDLKYSLNGKETPLMLLLHMADMWSSRVTEKENEE